MKWTGRTIPEQWQAPFVILIIFFVLGVFGIIAFDQLNERRARDSVLSALSDVSANATVKIDGTTRQSAQLLEALRTLHHVESHHSSPLQPRRIEIRDGSKSIDLVVAQDSERSNEYWVYRPGWNYHNDANGEFLGVIQTDIFKDF